MREGEDSREYPEDLQGQDGKTGDFYILNYLLHRFVSPDMTAFTSTVLITKNFQIRTEKVERREVFMIHTYEMRCKSCEDISKIRTNFKIIIMVIENLVSGILMCERQSNNCNPKGQYS